MGRKMNLLTAIRQIGYITKIGNKQQKRVYKPMIKVFAKNFIKAEKADEFISAAKINRYKTLV
ncbi:hypothetical protein LBYZC6_43450 [Lacrimispora brassicae]